MTQRINIAATQGWTELVSVREIDGATIRMGAYSIRRDARGREISRSDVEWTCFLRCASEAEAKRLDRWASCGVDTPAARD